VAVVNRGVATRRRVPRHRAAEYWQVATHLMESARTLLTLGDKEYGNAIGIRIIHAVISANDAVTIKLGEVRSSSEQHADARRLLQELAKKVPESVLRAYSSVVQAKFEYEYSGDVFTPTSARRLLIKAEAFYRWALEQLR
jgi:hypothetical protein